MESKEELASIREAERSLVDPDAQQCQVAIECSIIEGTQLDVYGGSIPHDGA